MELELSEQAFWDVDPNDIKGKEHAYASWIIKRVAQYGTVNDMVSTDIFYGREKVIEKVLVWTCLPQKIMIQIRSKKQFRNCFQTLQACMIVPIVWALRFKI